MASGREATLGRPQSLDPCGSKVTIVHPAESRAFKWHGIPEPIGVGWQLTIDGDWVCEVRQAAYGHRAKKRTWLLYHGDAPPPPLDWSDADGTHQIGWFDIKRPQLPKSERAATPTAFRDALISIARSSRNLRQ